jgi:antitoxin ParD1/3/4
LASSLHISLPDPLKAYVDQQVEAGDYTSPSEYFTDLIRHEKEIKLANLENRLRTALEGEADALELTAAQVRAGNLLPLIQEHARRSR